MSFLALIIALSAWRLGRMGPRPDQWFYRILNFIRACTPSATAGWLVAVIIPCLGFELAQRWLHAHSWPVWIPLASAALYYSLGRGRFSEAVERYINGSRADHWPDAAAAYAELGGDSASLPAGDWPVLHAAMLERASYRGFERLFAVIFWFAIAGPGAALVYRLSQLMIAAQPTALAGRWLWLLEWPAVRLLGITFAFTGNFIGCVQRWRQYFCCVQSSTALVAMQSVLGALTVANGQEQTSAVTRRELAALVKLLARSLWFWLGALALIAITN